MNDLAIFIFGMGFGIIWVYFWTWMTDREISNTENKRGKK